MTWQQATENVFPGSTTDTLHHPKYSNQPACALGVKMKNHWHKGVPSVSMPICVVIWQWNVGTQLEFCPQLLHRHKKKGWNPVKAKGAWFLVTAMTFSTAAPECSRVCYTVLLPWGVLHPPSPGGSRSSSVRAQHGTAQHGWTQVGSPVPAPQLAGVGLFNGGLGSRVFSAWARTGGGRSEFSPSPSWGCISLAMFHSSSTYGAAHTMFPRLISGNIWWRIERKGELQEICSHTYPFQCGWIPPPPTWSQPDVFLFAICTGSTTLCWKCFWAAGLGGTVGLQQDSSHRQDMPRPSTPRVPTICPALGPLMGSGDGVGQPQKGLDLLVSGAPQSLSLRCININI